LISDNASSWINTSVGSTGSSIEGWQWVLFSVPWVESIGSWSLGGSTGENGVLNSFEVWISNRWVVERSESWLGLWSLVSLSEDEVETESEDQQKSESQESEVKSIINLVDTIVIRVVTQVEQSSGGDSGTEGEQQSVDTQNVVWPDVEFLNTLATGWVQSTNGVGTIFPNEGSVSLGTGRSGWEILSWAPSWSEFILVNWSKISLAVSIWVSVSSSLPDVSQQETGAGKSEDEQDQRDHTQNEESSSVSEESNNDSKSTNNDTNNTENLEELSVEKAESAVDSIVVEFESFFTPVDHQPTEDDESEAGKVESIGGELESVVGNSPGSVSTESESEGSDGGENDQPVKDSSISSPGLTRAPSVWHMSVPFVSVSSPRGDSAQVSWLVESQPEGGSSEVNGEDQRTSESEEGKSRAWWLSLNDLSTGTGTPGSNGETDEHTEGSHKSVPESDTSSVSVVEDPTEDQGNKTGDTSEGSEDHSELGVSDFVFNVSWFSGEEVVSLEKRDFFISLGFQRECIVLEG
jgi:hypothetical protein